MTDRTAAQTPAPSPGLVIDVEATDLDQHGFGISRWHGWVIVTPDHLPGEKARVQLQQRQRSRWRARRLTLLRPSPSRQRPPCILATECGGCTLQHLSATGQAEWKNKAVWDQLNRIGTIGASTNRILSNDQAALGYRNRAFIPLDRNAEGRLRLGYYKRGSHRIVNLNRCPVLHPSLDALIAPLKSDLDASGWPADHDLLKAEGLRHLGLRLGVHTGEMLITLVSSHDRLPGLQGWAERWIERWPMVRGVTLNLQPKRSNLILGEETQLVAGDDCIRDVFCNQSLLISTTTFYQINTPQAERIVSILCEQLLSECCSGVVIDAYCGIGTISLPLAAHGFDVVGLELNKDSVDQANRNAILNQLEHKCQFEAGDVIDLLAKHLPRCDILVLDPPRKGLDPSVIATILGCPPQVIAYLSCDPSTQARDLKLILAGQADYAIQLIQPIDFFPQTSHLENLVIIKLVDHDGKNSCP